MTIFTKAIIIDLLNNKITNGEIQNFNLNSQYLRITKSKRTGFTIKLNQFSQQNLVALLKKKTPKPEVQNLSNFYKNEIKKINDPR